jgi:Zn-dependent M28 family amino/carboxypeptidase
VFTIATACAPSSPTAATTPPASAPSSAAPSLGDAAYARLEALMQHPRGLGHPRRDASIDALAEMLTELGARDVGRFSTMGTDPRSGTEYALTSLVGHVRPDADRRFVLATHFDTRPWADESPDPADRTQPVPGANDGTSGVAVVLEIAARLPEVMPDDVGWSIVLFDGEELGRPEQGGYCVGSRDLAERLVAGEDPRLRRAQLGIVFDMVGDADLSLPVEPSSADIHPALVDHVWRTAATRGHTAFDPTPRAVGVIDDHRFLTEAGIPSILLIDRDYPPWHTTHDTIDKVSAESLHAVGDTVLHALATWFAR